MTYYVITAEVHGELKTGLVEENAFEEEGKDASAFFLHGAMNPSVHGTVEISGEAEHMLTDVIVEG